MDDFFIRNLKWIIVGIVALIFLIVMLNHYTKVPPNVALIISGRIRRRYKVKTADGKEIIKKFGYRIVRGGATFVVPFFERVDKLNLGIMQVDIKTTQPVPSMEYISVMVDGVANIKIGSDDTSIATAAEQFLGWKPEQIAAIATQVLEGNMREIIGRMTIADLVQNRDKFASETSNAANYDMRNMGLEIINITIQNFCDQDGVVETMATRNIVEKKRDAEIASAQADQEGHKAKAEADAVIAQQSKDAELKKAQYRIEQETMKAKADLAYKIQEEIARKTFEEERANAELMRLQKQTELERQQVEVERQHLNVEIREKAEADRDAQIAKAQAERASREAQADAGFYEAQKQAEAILLKGKAEAEAIEHKAQAMQAYGEAAMLQMVVEKLPEVAKAIGEPLARTDKIIMFGEGATTGVTRDVTASMMQTFEAMKAAVGLDIPEMLRRVSTGGLVGRSSENPAPAQPEKENAPAQ